MSAILELAFIFRFSFFLFPLCTGLYKVPQKHIHRNIHPQIFTK